MLKPSIHAERRRRLTDRVDAPILLMGNGLRARNLPMSTVPFRQDSTFLYFTGCTEPGAALLLNGSSETLYLPTPAADDALWHGHSETIEETGERYGFASVRPTEQLEADSASLDPIATIAVPDLAQTIRASHISGSPLDGQ